MDELARALKYTFSSPNVPDANGEPANVVDAIAMLATEFRRGLRDLGNADAATPMGAIEAHGKAITDAASTIAMSIDSLAQTIGALQTSPRNGKGK